MKKFKMIISVLLSVILIFLLCFSSVSGVSVKSGTAALRKQFKRGEGPKVGNLSIDYSYYSPVKSVSDKTKYPLVVVAVGQGENKNPGDELEMNDFCTWSADEYQRRFSGTKGAFILIARAREEKMLSWNQPVLIEPLGMAVEDFVKKNKNVDPDRVIMYGWSYGGMAALRVAAERPDLFAAVVAASPTILLAEEKAEKMKNMSVWMILSKDDTIAPYATMTYPTWELIKKHTNNPGNIRLTTYDDCPNTDHIINHNSWREIIHDFDKDKEGYSGRQTVDGYGNKVNEKDGLLSWMSAQRLYHETPRDKCKHECHVDNDYIGVFWRIRTIYWKIFEVNDKKFCKCGARHW